MPSLLESLFAEKGGEKVSFQDVIERGLRVARGESFAPIDPSTEGLIPDFQDPIETSGNLEALFKGLTRAAEKGITGFKERIGFDPMVSSIAPQRAVEPKFKEIENPTILEQLFETAGEFAPQLLGGLGTALPSGSIGAGMAIGASEDILAGGSAGDIAAGAIGGGVGGFLSRFAKNLGDPAVSRVLGRIDEFDPAKFTPREIELIREADKAKWGARGVENAPEAAPLGKELPPRVRDIPGEVPNTAKMLEWWSRRLVGRLWILALER